MSKPNSFFDNVNSKPDFPAEERRLLDHWYKTGIVKKYLKKNINSPKRFSFLDGPITANNPMGIHHAWGRTYKDLWQRFYNMRGYSQRFQNGFDAQGLWVEVEVEKELGFKSKKEIEKFGVKKFVELCWERVKKFSSLQTEQSKRLGYFMDWDNSYFTLSDDNNYAIWHFLKVCHQNGWLYKGNDSVPWCPRCETAISQHEILTEDYKEITHKSIVLEFPIVGRKDEYLLVWTTTPWTIPANIAIALDADLDYALVKGDTGDKYWLAEKTLKRVFAKGKKPEKVVKGLKLVGLKYKGAFDALPAVDKVARKNPKTFHTVVATDQRILPVTVEEGTGLVHTAVSAGTEDFKLGKKLGLPMIPVINDDASYMEGLGDLSGQNAKGHPELIFEYLSQREEKYKENWVFDIFDYKHRYPVCWRCKTELVWKVTNEWYIAMDKPSQAQSGKTLRKRMIAAAKKIRWIPEFGLDRELDWLTNMSDWLISKKNRYWGLALPIWECTKCGNFEVIGSREELKEEAVAGWKEFEGKTPHKPQIDKVKIKCSSCGEVISRIEPVGNPWLDAGIVTYSTISENNKACNFYPTETKPLYYTDKKAWEKWFPVDFITESFPGQFKNWFYSLIAMSAVLEKREPFKTVLGFATLLGEDGRPMHKSWGNAIEFNEGADKIGVDVMRWMYTKQNPSENLLFGYKVADETRRKFHLKLWNVYNFFVTYANSDGWFPAKLNGRKNDWPDSSNVLDKWILARLNKTLLQVTEKLEDYEVYSASAFLEELVDDLSNWYIRRSRDRVGPTADLEKDKSGFYQACYFVLVTLSKILAPFIPFMAEIMYQNLTKEESVHLADWPKASGLVNQKLISDMENIRLVVEKAHAIRKEKNIPVRQPLSSLTTIAPFITPENLKVFVKDELNVKEWQIRKGSKMENKLDTKITNELKEESKARELTRKVQLERRKMGMRLTQKIEIISPWIPSSKEVTQMLKKRTLATSLEKGKFLVRKSS